MIIKNGIFFVFIVLASCSLQTSYQKERDFEGYSEQKLNVTTYRVSFKANADSDQTRVYDFTMLRAAQITLKQGYKFFSVAFSENRISYKNIIIQRAEPERFLHFFDSTQDTGYTNLEYVTTNHTLKKNNICEMVDTKGNTRKVDMNKQKNRSDVKEMNKRHQATNPVTPFYSEKELKQNDTHTNFDNSFGSTLVVGPLYPDRVSVAILEVITVIHLSDKNINTNTKDMIDATKIIKNITQKYQFEL
ncbi:MAG: hypothetical protein ACC653_12185 [Gammaproteobacteria bacterium]